MKIDAVEQRAREPCSIIFCAARRLPAGQFGKMTAAARVHRSDQLEPRRVGDVPLGAGDVDAAGLQRLAERFECSAVELRELVEKKDALVGKRDFSWTRARSAANESRQRGRMMRIAEWPLAA